MGIIISLLIIVLWIGNLYLSLFFSSETLVSGWTFIFIPLQTWLSVGLFIVAHDAMHGSISRMARLNEILGSFCTFLYAGLWFPRLIKKHKLHHESPGTELDPDYSSDQRFFIWWWRFMKEYLTIWQLVIMAVIFNIGLLFFSEGQLLLYWVLPLVLSTFQLFYFGTYQPHKLPHFPMMEPYKARTYPYSKLVAFITCFYFGYHFEHHFSPKTPWWRLPSIKKQLMGTKQV